MPNQVNKQTPQTPHRKASHHCSTIAAAFPAVCLFPCSFWHCLSPSSLVPYVAPHLRPLVCAPLVFPLYFPFLFSPLLFLLFMAQGEILVSTVPHAPPLVTSSLGGWGSPRSVKRLVLLAEREVKVLVVLWEPDVCFKWWPDLETFCTQWKHQQSFLNPFPCSKSPWVFPGLVVLYISIYL